MRDLQIGNLVFGKLGQERIKVAHYSQCSMILGFVNSYNIAQFYIKRFVGYDADFVNIHIPNILHGSVCYDPSVFKEPNSVTDLVNFSKVMRRQEYRPAGLLVLS